MRTHNDGEKPSTSTAQHVDSVEDDVTLVQYAVCDNFYTEDWF